MTVAGPLSRQRRVVQCPAQRRSGRDRSDGPHVFAGGLLAGNGEVYNVGDSVSGVGVTWREKWAGICEYFGLVGVGARVRWTGSQHIGLHA